MRNATKQSEAAPGLRDDGDSCRTQATAPDGGSPFESTDDYQRAVQALRNVRHMLPPDGVAMVDAILDGESFGWTDAGRPEGILLN